jgi:hypothetical protein
MKGQTVGGVGQSGVHERGRGKRGRRDGSRPAARVQAGRSMLAGVDAFVGFNNQAGLCW